METVNKNDLQNSKCLKQFKLKPNKTIYMFIFLAVAMMVFFPRIETFIAGAVILIVPLINVLVVKDRVLLEIYDSFFVVYDDKGSGIKIEWNEVTQYEFVSESQTSTYFKIMAGEDVFAITTSDNGVLGAFRKRIPDQEASTKQKKEREARRKERKAARRSK